MSKWRSVLREMKRDAEKDGSGGEREVRLWSVTFNTLPCPSCGKHSVVTAKWVGPPSSSGSPRYASARSHAMEIAEELGAPLPTLRTDADPPGSLGVDEFESGAMVWHWKKNPSCQERDDVMRLMANEAPSTESSEYDPSFDPPPAPSEVAQNPAIASSQPLPSIGGAFGLRSATRGS